MWVEFALYAFLFCATIATGWFACAAMDGSLFDFLLGPTPSRQPALPEYSEMEEWDERFRDATGLSVLSALQFDSMGSRSENSCWDCRSDDLVRHSGFMACKDCGWAACS